MYTLPKQPFMWQLCIVLLSIGGALGVKKQIPSYVEKCSLTSSREDIRKCFFDNVEIIRPKLAIGIPELRVPPIDPIVFESMDLSINNFKAMFRNVEVRGLSTFNMNEMDFDLKKRMIHVKCIFPHLYIKGNYEMSGKLLVFSLDSSGPYTQNMSNILAEATFVAGEEKIKGKTYFKFIDSEKKIHLEVKGHHAMYLENLFKNNEELTRNTNQVINDNIVELTKEFMPVVEEVVGSFVFGLIDQVFKSFPLEELFLDY